MFQNYSLDIGFTYYFTKFNFEQSLVIETIVNQLPVDVLTTYLPTINSQLIAVNESINCELPKGIQRRRVEIELLDNKK